MITFLGSRTYYTVRNVLGGANTLWRIQFFRLQECQQLVGVSFRKTYTCGKRAITEEADEVRANYVGKEWSDPAGVDLYAWVKDYTKQSVGTMVRQIKLTMLQTGRVFGLGGKHPI